MFTIKKNGRKLKNAPLFDTYDRARSYARSMIRRAVKPNAVVGPYDANARLAKGWDRFNRNPPSIAAFKYQVVRV
jgi:hypothetical protein